VLFEIVRINFFVYLCSFWRSSLMFHYPDSSGPSDDVVIRIFSINTGGNFEEEYIYKIYAKSNAGFGNPISFES
jgi:hypothetical protein